MQESEKLDKILKETANNLIEVRNWEILAPDIVTVDLNRITIKRVFILGIQDTKVVSITDIANSELNRGIFFSKVTLFSKFFTDNKHEVHWIPNHAAEQLHWVIQGLLTLNKEEVDVKKLPREGLLWRLISIGKK